LRKLPNCWLLGCPDEPGRELGALGRAPPGLGLALGLGEADGLEGVLRLIDGLRLADPLDIERPPPPPPPRPPRARASAAVSDRITIMVVVSQKKRLISRTPFVDSFTDSCRRIPDSWESGSSLRTGLLFLANDLDLVDVRERLSVDLAVD
jgi:hypothetical protein